MGGSAARPAAAAARAFCARGVQRPRPRERRRRRCRALWFGSAVFTSPLFVSARCGPRHHAAQQLRAARFAAVRAAGGRAPCCRRPPWQTSDANPPPHPPTAPAGHGRQRGHRPGPQGQGAQALNEDSQEYLSAAELARLEACGGSLTARSARPSAPQQHVQGVPGGARQAFAIPQAARRNAGQGRGLRTARPAAFDAANTGLHTDMCAAHFMNRARAWAAPGRGAPGRWCLSVAIDTRLARLSGSSAAWRRESRERPSVAQHLFVTPQWGPGRQAAAPPPAASTLRTQMHLRATHTHFMAWRSAARARVVPDRGARPPRLYLLLNTCWRLDGGALLHACSSVLLHAWPSVLRPLPRGSARGSTRD